MREWIDIPSCPGYKASRDGYILNKKDQIHRQSVGGRARVYLKVGLHHNGKAICRWVHRLIAEVFVPNPHNYDEVDHIDHNKQNNNADNLRWVSRQQNMDNACAAGRILRGELQRSAKLTEDQVRLIRNLNATDKSATVTVLAKRFGLHTSQMSRVINRKYWKHVL